jgi:hypothetical protein
MNIEKAIIENQGSKPDKRREFTWECNSQVQGFLDLPNNVDRFAGSERMLAHMAQLGRMFIEQEAESNSL